MKGPTIGPGAQYAGVATAIKWLKRPTMVLTVDRGTLEPELQSGRKGDDPSPIINQAECLQLSLTSWHCTRTTLLMFQNGIS